MWTGIIIAGVIVLLAMCAEGSGMQNEDVTRGRHHLLGKYRVLYNDGYLSQPMMKNTARSYSKMFDGRVVSRGYNGPRKKL